MTTIVWLRDDLRIADNPALAHAADRGPVVVTYIRDEQSPGVRPLGSASKWWLHHSLDSLGAALEALGASLVLRTGPAPRVLDELIAETGATAVHWNRRYGAAREVDAAIKSSLRERGLEAESFQANLAFEPWTILNGSGEPYRVFTPFWKACLARGVARGPIPAPAALSSVAAESESLASWGLLPTHPDWADGLRATWVPGEAGANAALDRFASGALAQYHRRDEPGVEATSMLSPHLRFGEVSPFQLHDRMQRFGSGDGSQNVAKFLSEVGWREFSYSILFNFPELATRNYRSEFDRFPWEQGRQHELEAWQQGRTGVPLVDAGMRQLWATGYMHNRVRMVVASFLVKNLLVDWRVGEQWFWDTLVDADEANNPASWQWVAGSGADAAPYFRVFNPVLQASKFDPKSTYISRWVPEVGTMAYPDPIVDLAESRKDALAAYEVVKRVDRPA